MNLDVLAIALLFCISTGVVVWMFYRAPLERSIPEQIDYLLDKSEKMRAELFYMAGEFASLHDYMAGTDQHQKLMEVITKGNNYQKTLSQLMEERKA